MHIHSPLDASAMTDNEKVAFSLDGIMAESRTSDVMSSRIQHSACNTWMFLCDDIIPHFTHEDKELRSSKTNQMLNSVLPLLLSYHESFSII